MICLYDLIGTGVFIECELGIKVDRSRLKTSCEAWVFVQVYAEDGSIPLQTGFEAYPRLGVQTWSNSD
ncbi:MAG: DUF6210 family protein [Alphaproteobacteria bacterium]